MALGRPRLEAVAVVESSQALTLHKREVDELVKAPHRNVAPHRIPFVREKALTFVGSARIEAADPCNLIAKLLELTIEQ